MVIVETTKEYSEFLEDWNKHPSIVIPVWEDLELHSQCNHISFFYIRGNFNWIIPINHNDCQNIQFDLSTSEHPKWIWNKKSFLQSNIHIKNTYDIQSHIFFNYHKEIEFNPKESSFISHYYKIGIHNKLGKIAPVMKWNECISDFVDSIKNYLIDFTDSWIDSFMIPTLAKIEQYGICVDEDKFNKRFPNLDRFIKNGRVYTQYNPYIITSRPSNRFGGINYSALNKTDGTREVFIPKRDSIFLQMDFDAYHIRIIGKLIGETLPETSAHAWLAEQYGVGYDEAKQLTFQILYGGVPDEFTEIPYFRGVKNYIEALWSDTQKTGEVRLKYRKIPLEWIDNPNPQKVFNYLLQGLETEINLDKINRVLDFIKDTDIELNLYTYDAFLFSYPMEMSTSAAIELKNILESGGFPIRVTWGMNYGKV